MTRVTAAVNDRKYLLLLKLLFIDFVVKNEQKGICKILVTVDRTR